MNIGKRKQLNLTYNDLKDCIIQAAKNNELHDDIIKSKRMYFPEKFGSMDERETMIDVTCTNVTLTMLEDEKFGYTEKEKLYFAKEAMFKFYDRRTECTGRCSDKEFYARMKEIIGLFGDLVPLDNIQKMIENEESTGDIEEIFIDIFI